MKILLAWLVSGCAFAQYGITPNPGDPYKQGAGVTTAGGLTDCAVTRTSPTVLTIGSTSTATTPCRVKFGNTVYAFASPATVTISAGAVQAFLYVTSAGALTAGSNGDTLVGSNASIAAAITAFPSDSVPLATWTATAGTWDVSGGVDQRSVYGTVPLVAGSGVILSYGTGIATVSSDTAFSLSRATDQAGLDNTCFPASASGTAYTCSVVPALSAYSATEHPITFKPDVSSGASPVALNINGLGPITLQKNVNGTLTNVTTNDLTAGVPYVLLPVGNPVTAWEVVPTNFAAGANPAGTGSELQYRSTGTAFAALANSSVPNSGELLRNTVPAASATRSIDGLGAAPAACPSGVNAGCYNSINAPAAFVGDFQHNELNGVIVSRVWQPFGGNALQLGTNAGGVFLNNTTSGTLSLTDAGGGSTINVNIGNPVAIQFKGTTGLASTYKSLATAGIGLTPVYGVVSLTGQIAAIATATLCAAAVCTGGQYNMDAYLDSTVTCATPGPAAVGLTLTWTDETGTKSAITVPLDVNGGVTLGATMGLGNTTNSANGRISLWSSGANPIQYATSYTGCTAGTGTYAIRLAVSQLQ